MIDVTKIVHLVNPIVLVRGVDLDLELVAAIGRNGLDTRGRLFENVIDDAYGIGLVVSLIDLDGSVPRGIIDDRVL